MPEGRRRDHGNPARIEQLFEQGAVYERHLAHQSELGILAFRAKEAAIDPGETDRRNAACDQRRDHATVRQAAEDRQREVPRIGIGDPQPTHEPCVHAEPLGPFADRRAAPVHDDEGMAAVAERHDRIEGSVRLSADGTADLQHQDVPTWCIRH